MSIRHQAMNYLARREHSRHELQEKLLMKGWNADDIALELEALIHDSLQSDERFAESFLHNKVRLGYGPCYIERALIQKGVHSEIIEAVLATIVCWDDVLDQVWKKKFGRLPIISAEKALTEKVKIIMTK